MPDPNEQDKLSDNWGLDDTSPVNGTTPAADEAAMSAEWAAMLEGDANADAAGGADRVLNQDEIDSLLGFDPNAGANVELTGVQALVNSALVSYERLPMLEI